MAYGKPEPPPVPRGPRILRLSRLALLALALRLTAGGGRLGDNGTAPEQQVKAAFLFNFTRFVEWPPSAFSSAGASFVIGIVGGDEVENILETFTWGKTFDGRRLEVRRVDARSARSCQLLFVPRQQEQHLEEILSAVEGLPVLLVGETEGFTGRGGVINFVLADRRVRFEINPAEAAARHLKISSKLLQLAVLSGGAAGK